MDTEEQVEKLYNEIIDFIKSKNFTIPPDADDNLLDACQSICRYDCEY